MTAGRTRTCERCGKLVRLAQDGPLRWVHEHSGIEFCDASELGEQLSRQWLDPLGMFEGSNRRAA